MPVAQLLRLEIEEAGPDRSLDQLEDAVRARVRDARSGGIAGLKSIAAYRGGLQIEPRSADDAAGHFPAFRKYGARAAHCG